MGARLQQSGSSRRGSGRRSKSHQPMSEINVTPFVDVMLVLLIIFMVTAPMMVSGVQVDLPDAVTESLSMDEDPLSVTVDAEGNIYLNTNEVLFADLVPKLEAIIGAKRKNQARVLVRGDEAAEYGNVIQVIAHIHQSGFTRVGLQTDPTKK